MRNCLIQITLHRQPVKDTLRGSEREKGLTIVWSEVCEAISELSTALPLSVAQNWVCQSVLMEQMLRQYVFHNTVS